MLKENLLTMRKFPPIDDKNGELKIINIGLPVEIFECSANVKVDNALDSLAEAILKFISIRVTGNKEIADIVGVSSDIVQSIKNNKLQMSGYIDEKSKITELGESYLKDEVIDVFSEQKVFGYMFINKADGDVMPYFHTGKLPQPRKYEVGDIKDILRIKIPNEKDAIFKAEKNVNELIESYKKHCKISQYCEKNENDDIDELTAIITGQTADSLVDTPYDEIGDNEERTLADVEEEKEANLSYVRVLKNTPIEMFLQTKIVVSRDNPEEFYVLSPFENNNTVWYSRKLPFLREKNNNVKIGNDEHLDDFLNEKTEQFYGDFPKMQNFDYYMKINFPKLKKVEKLEKKVLVGFKSYFNMKNLYEEKRVDGDAVANNANILLETLINSFIALTSNRVQVLNNTIISTYDRETYDSIFAKFNIRNCTASKSAETFCQSLKRWKHGRVGNSIIQRYFFLALEAYTIGRNPFGTILLSENANEFINKLDKLFEIRSKYGAHNDMDFIREMPDNLVVEFMTDAEYCIKIFVDTLYNYYVGGKGNDS